MSKQDRQGVRTTQGLEQKYSFGKVFSKQERENARQNSELNQQNLTQKQFVSYASDAIEKLNQSIQDINKTIVSLTNKDTELEKNLTSKIEAYWKTVYPVGHIYISVSSTNPSTLFGGTWERIQDRFLLAAGGSYEAGSTGGEATHTLTIDEMPSHKHKYYYPGHDAGTSWYGQNGVASGTQAETNSVGGGKAHNNMPPYLAVYVWKRVS